MKRTALVTMTCVGTFEYRGASFHALRNAQSYYLDDVAKCLKKRLPDADVRKKWSMVSARLADDLKVSVLFTGTLTTHGRCAMSRHALGALTVLRALRSKDPFLKLKHFRLVGAVVVHTLRGSLDGGALAAAMDRYVGGQRRFVCSRVARFLGLPLPGVEE